MLHETSASQNSTHYLSLTNGRISLRLKEPRDGYQETVVSNSKGSNTYYCKFFNSFTGFLRGITLEDFGNSVEFYRFHFVCETGGENYILSLGYQSPVAAQLINKLQNCILSMPIEIGTWLDAKTNKPALSVKQEGIKVGMHNTKEDPKGMPEVHILKGRDGKQSYNFTEVNAFWYEVSIKLTEAANSITPVFIEAPQQIAAPKVSALPPPQKTETQTPPSNDDLPF